MHEHCSAGPMPCAFDPTRWGAKGRPMIKVHCKKKDVVREFRFLISKLSYDPKGLDDGEVIAVTELALRLDDMAARDNNYRLWIVPLKAIRPLLEKLRPGQSRASGLKGKFMSLDLPATALIFGPHEYFGLKGQKRPGHFRVLWSYPVKRRPVTSRWMGVGYKDKGNLRNKARDGTPDWKEVAVDEKMRSEWRADRDWSMFSENTPEGILYLRDRGSPSSTAEPWRIIQSTSKSEWIVI